MVEQIQLVRDNFMERSTEGLGRKRVFTHAHDPLESGKQSQRGSKGEGILINLTKQKKQKTPTVTIAEARTKA